MARLRHLGQFGQMFKRTETTVVQTVEQRSHSTGEGAIKLWRNLTLFGAVPAILLSTINCYINHINHKEERPEPIPYPYMKIMNKRFPWGDGKHSLFHNPKKNWIPGVGYEE
ncbi:PREDICTED: cytochrome c oxidase subunit 6A1, mitochondrial-like [Dufourea novaeangliae]|uniref:Cytochrome c oxidase subunit 6A1, mitochondrial n=1 Tax=Dufourea novaeangliae TaxID=178035 RepID=A0A154PFS0_DUFNO|nr:PREDICTED: cytochrome c oxidase subunit 6A1, mitochondrial-like [Dufourea novaeangliae]KZC10662.1 Cytochrome c oxidase subunit 6A1, mitochondrial [Dufourea novaeangliae]